jgi:hypothetical protein
MNGSNQYWPYQPPGQPPGGVGGMPPPGLGAAPPGTSPPGVFPPGTSGPPRRQVPRWWWVAAVGITVMAVVAVVIFLAVRPSGNTSDDRRWSAFPHTMGCVTDPPNLSMPQDPDAPVVPLTDAVRVDQVSLTHPGGQEVELSIEFRDAVPPVPRTVLSPDTGGPEDVPGSIEYTVILGPPAGTGRNGRATGLTQTELAANLGVGQAQISKIERQGDMLISTLASYLAALGVDAQILVEVGEQTVRYNLTAGRGER